MNWNVLFLLLSLFSLSLGQNYSYLFININKTWSDAQTYCRAHYTDLATVHDQADAQRLCGSRSNCPGASGPWIGLYHDSTADRKWRWSQPALKFNPNVTKWDVHQSQPNHPEGNVENCVFAKADKWHDMPCDAKLRFCCYDSGSTNSVVYDETKTWLEALQVCRQHRADLIGGTQQTPNHGYDFWIGLFRDSWQWSDGSNSSFRNWNERETILNNNWNPINQQCARLGEQNQWTSADCGEERAFICYDDQMILIREKKSWEEALLYCRRNHGDLVVMTNRHQRRMVQEKANMADTAHVWVGLHYTCFFEEWIWVDGRFVDKGKWDGKEAHECGRAGAVARGGAGKWFGRRSTDENNFVCSVSQMLTGLGPCY